MAPTLFDGSCHPNTVEENEKILHKIAIKKIDSHRPEELVKLFAKLNAAETPRSQNILQNSSIGHQRLQRVNYGPIPGISPGAWWAIRLDCSRDLVHVPFNEDIEVGSFGATSLCTSHSPSNDADFGDFLTITGPEYSEEILEKDPLFRSCKNHVPLRLVRSYNLTNKFAPKTGYRYDGLYAVVSGWIAVSSGRKNLKFALARLNYQEPPPWEPQGAATLKKTRTKAKITQRCHMDCCKADRKNSPEDKLESISIEKLLISKPQDKQPKDSTIVMRNVLKKSESTPGVESPILVSSKSIRCKLQNTNISIRTDLYDSSPNPHQDVKRIPMTFSRIYGKSSKPQPIQSKTCSTSSVGVLNLNVCGPGANNKIGESLIQMRSGCGKSGEVISQKSSVVLHENSTGNTSCSDIQKSIPKSKDQNSILSLQSTQNNTNSIDSQKSKCSQSSEAIIPKSSQTEKSVGKNLYSLRSSSTDKSEKMLVESKINRRSIINGPVIQRSKESGDTRKGVKTQLNTSKKQAKAFSKASVKTKRQNELAKLVIDANFVTKIGGPRTRRFPYAMRGFSKRGDNLKHLKCRSNPKKIKLLHKTAVKEKNTRIPQNREKEKIQKRKGSEGALENSKELGAIRVSSRTNKRNELKNAHEIANTDSVNDGTKKSVSRATQIFRRVKMVDRSTQCTLQKDAATSIDIRRQSRSNDSSGECWSIFEELKSEVSDDNNPGQVHSRNLSTQTNRESEIVRPNCIKATLESSAILGKESSAFAPIDMSDIDFRVARLRSIGFKPIHQPCFLSRFGESAFCECRRENSKRKEVDGKYNKYTSEENDVVGYMDTELRFEDIEAEAVNSAVKKGRIRVVNELRTRVLRKRKSDGERTEGPWKGWKKLI